MLRLVAIGTWLYDGDVPMPVRVIESDRDFWFDVGQADGELEEDESPHLNEKGRCYYVLYRDLDLDRFWPDSIGFLSLEEALAEAEAKVPTEVEWTRR